MNAANRIVREAARGVAEATLTAVGVQADEMESHFGEGSEGAAIELRLTRFAEAILAQATPRPPSQSLQQSIGAVGNVGA